MFWFGPDEEPSEEDKKLLHALNRKIETWEAYTANPTEETAKAHLKAVKEYNKVLGRDE